MIAIKDMEMPKCCAECDFIQRGYPDWCDLRVSSRDIFNDKIRPDWCPLVEVKGKADDAADAVPVVMINGYIIYGGVRKTDD